MLTTTNIIAIVILVIIEIFWLLMLINIPVRNKLANRWQWFISVLLMNVFGALEYYGKIFSNPKSKEMPFFVQSFYLIQKKWKVYLNISFMYFIFLLLFAGGFVFMIKRLQKLFEYNLAGKDVEQMIASGSLDIQTTLVIFLFYVFGFFIVMKLLWLLYQAICWRILKFKKENIFKGIIPYALKFVWFNILLGFITLLFLLILSFLPLIKESFIYLKDIMTGFTLFDLTNLLILAVIGIVLYHFYMTFYYLYSYSQKLVSLINSIIYGLKNFFKFLSAYIYMIMFSIYVMLLLVLFGKLNEYVFLIIFAILLSLFTSWCKFLLICYHKKYTKVTS